MQQSPNSSNEHPWNQARTIVAVTNVLDAEIAGLQKLRGTLESQVQVVQQICELIRTRCCEGGPGRLILTGIGKAGKIADKLAATFASTGTPSLFLHPAEARHGDLGMVNPHDVVLALSNSGASEEVVFLIPSIRRIGATLIAMVGPVDSPLGRHADLVLTVGHIQEACPLGLAPSASTTALLAFGDALALTVQQQRNFTPAQYARFHPGGSLGRKLITCAEVMRTGDRVPAVKPDTAISECLSVITRARAGLVLIVDAERKLQGVFTDGDFRRLLLTVKDPAAALRSPVSQHLRSSFVSVHGTDLVQHALHLCAEKPCNEIPVLDRAGVLLGHIHLQDLADRGFETAKIN